MATGAGSHVGLTLQADLQRFVNGVTAGASSELLAVKMWFVAFGAVWNISVLGVVTILAVLFRMHARELLELCNLSGVATGALPIQRSRCRDHPRSVRVGMAGQAGGMGLAVRKFMATRAFGHDLRVIVPQRIVSVDYFVAILAVESMFPTILFQATELVRVTFGTIENGQRLRLGIVRICRDRRLG